MAVQFYDGVDAQLEKIDRRWSACGYLGIPLLNSKEQIHFAVWPEKMRRNLHRIQKNGNATQLKTQLHDSLRSHLSLSTILMIIHNRSVFIKLVCYSTQFFTHA